MRIQVLRLPLYEIGEEPFVLIVDSTPDEGDVEPPLADLVDHVPFDDSAEMPP